MNGRGQHGFATVAGLADLVVVGPAPPLRGGIAAHTARLVEAARGQGKAAVAASWSRLYPPGLHPARSLVTAQAAPAWSSAVLDVLSPATWSALGRDLEASEATILLQWWHPVVAPALLVASRHVTRHRLVAFCHNVLPHESFPGSRRAARLLLSRCSRVVCHSRPEAELALSLVGPDTSVVEVPLPCLLPAGAFASSRPAPELAAIRAGARLFVAAGHLRPYKATAPMLRAWLRARRPPGAVLVVVGESYLGAGDRREVADLAGSDSSIVFVNRYVDDEEFVRFLASAEALVLAHRAASQSGVLSIAKALGVPALVSDAGGLAAQAGGLACEVVKAGDEDGLVAAFEKRFAAGLGEQPEARLARAASRDISSDWRGVVEAIGIAARP